MKATDDYIEELHARIDELEAENERLVGVLAPDQGRPILTAADRIAELESETAGLGKSLEGVDELSVYAQQDRMQGRIDYLSAEVLSLTQQRARLLEQVRTSNDRIVELAYENKRLEQLCRDAGYEF